MYPKPSGNNLTPISFFFISNHIIAWSWWIYFYFLTRQNSLFFKVDIFDYPQFRENLYKALRLHFSLFLTTLFSFSPQYWVRFIMASLLWLSRKYYPYHEYSKSFQNLLSTKISVIKLTLSLNFMTFFSWGAIWRRSLIFVRL